MNRKIIVIVSILLFSLNVLAQNNYELREKYIREYKNIAINEMNKYGIPASITLAQGILESGAGKSKLATKGKNHFGIKCHKEWRGDKMYQKDDRLHDCFRVYDDEEDSYRDHSEFLSNKSRYASLFELEITDYKGWAKGLKKAGYATNPKYSKMLIKLIKEHDLTKYDKLYSPGKYIETELFKEGYDFASSDGFRKVGAKGGRNIYENNGKRFIFVVKGDTYYSLARKFNVRLGRLKKFNDMDKSNFLKEGQMVYLQKKRWRSKEIKRYTVKEQDTWYSISQRFGVRLNWLLKFNRKKDAVHIKPGQKLWLNFYKPSWRR